jgi:outer membrane cobalamin receptor
MPRALCRRLFPIRPGSMDLPCRSPRSLRRPFSPCAVFPFLFPAFFPAFCAALFLSAGPSHADGEGNLADTLMLPAARVAALRPPTAAKAVLVPSDVDRQMGNLGDLLQRLAGAHVMRAGELGDYLGVSLRGASESQVNVYVNGVLQNQAVDASQYLSDWDLARVERVEVYKGLAPEDLPGSPMGGAINIITREAATGGPHLRAALGAGSFGAFKANGAAELAAGAWRGRVQAARDQADGDFPYYDDGGLEYRTGRDENGVGKLGPDDLIRKIRRNNAHGLTDAAGDLAWHSAAAELGLQGGWSDLEKEIPAPYAGVDSTVRVKAALATDKASLHGRGRWTTGRAEASLDLSGSRLSQVYVDTSKAGGEIGIGYNHERDLYLDGRADARLRLELGGGWELAALGGYGATGYWFSDRIKARAFPGVFRYEGEGKVTPTFAQGRHSAQASLDLVFDLQEQGAAQGFGPNGSLLPAEVRDRRTLMRFGYQYRLGAKSWLFAEGGQAARQPTFLEMYGDRGTVVGNAGLRPESGQNGSAGAHTAGADWSAELTGYAAAHRNLISVEQNGQYVLVYRNAGKARILGAETRLAAYPFPWTRSELDLTLQRASSGSEWLGPTRIPNRPDFQASLRQTLMARGWTLGASAYYQGLTYPNPGNLPSLFDSYSHNTRWQARCDLDLSWRLRHLLLAAGVRNLFDQRAFDFFNFPLPGRSFTAAVQAEL